MTDLFLGVDLGGTNVKLGVCTADGGARESLSIPTEADRGVPHVIDRIGAAAERLTARTGKVRACGSGVPGPLDLQRRTIIVAPNMPGWNGVPYPDLLSRRLGLPTTMENDANCAAWGEFVAGAGRDFASLVLYTLGTGIGGGIVLNGELWVGVSGAAGELGHMMIDPKGRVCGCGQIGCLEQYASATALAREYGKGSAKDCFDAAGRGEADAVAAIDRACDSLAIGLANMVHVLHPEIIVLAGGMAAGGNLLFDRVRKGTKKRVFPVSAEKIRIEPSKLGDDAGWLGAALWAARRTGAHAIREPTAGRR